MADVRPFRAVHYHDVRSASRRIAPPYDVLSADDKSRLLTADARNVVAVDLPHVPPKTAGPQEVYAAAAMTFRSWLADGTLTRFAGPAFYPYSQIYGTGTAGPLHRRGFMALVRLTPFGRDVIPHEKTHPGPIEDRMRLMRHTSAQLSPIFGLFEDPDGFVTDALYREADVPDIDARLDDAVYAGVRHHLWTMSDPPTVATVRAFLADRPVYIADGHHRYTTALAYRDALAAEAGGTLPDDHPANYALFTLVGMSEPGLTILGYHRTIGGAIDVADLVAPDAVRDWAGGVFDVQPYDGSPADERFLEREGTIGLYVGGRAYRLRPHREDPLASLEPARPAAWRSLDAAIAQRLLVDDLVPRRVIGDGPPAVAYTPDPAAAARSVDVGDAGLAVLLRPTPLEALVTLGRLGETMPQKSTYFAPKLATGLAFYDMSDAV